MTATLTNATATATNTGGRRTPWAMLGHDAIGSTTSEEALQRGGLDWDVKLRSLYVSLPGDKRVRLEDRKAAVRSTDQAVMGIVSTNYVPFQNRQAFSFTDSLVENGQAEYDVVGQMRGGKTGFTVMRLPETLDVAGDRHEQFMIVRTAHDGSAAITAAPIINRIACTNMVSWSIKSAKTKWTIRHVSNLQEKLAEAQLAIRTTLDYGKKFANEAEVMMRIPVSDEFVVQTLEDVLPHRPRTEAMIESVMQFYRESEFNGFTGTAWGAYNALTEYTQHGRDTRSPASMLYNMLDGGFATVRNNFASALLA